MACAQPAMRASYQVQRLNGRAFLAPTRKSCGAAAHNERFLIPSVDQVEEHQPSAVEARCFPFITDVRPHILRGRQLYSRAEPLH
jgi:hypothetical protein